MGLIADFTDYHFLRYIRLYQPDGYDYTLVSSPSGVKKAKEMTLRGWVTHTEAPSRGIRVTLTPVGAAILARTEMVATLNPDHFSSVLRSATDGPQD